MSWLKKYDTEGSNVKMSNGGPIGGGETSSKYTSNTVPKNVNPNDLRPSDFVSEKDYIDYFKKAGYNYNCGKKGCADFANNYSGFAVGLSGVDRERWDREGANILSGHAWQNYGHIINSGGKSKYNFYKNEGNLKDLKPGDIVGLKSTNNLFSGAYDISGQNAPYEGVDNTHTGVVDFVDSNGNIYVKHNVGGKVRFAKIERIDQDPNVEGWSVVTAAEPNWGKYSPEFSYDDENKTWNFSPYKSDYDPNNILGLQSSSYDIYDETLPGNLSSNPIERSKQLKDYNWEKPSRNKRNVKLFNDKLNKALNSLNSNKKELMDYYRLSENEFNELAKNTIATLGVESKFGTSAKEDFKNEHPWLVNVAKLLKRGEFNKEGLSKPFAKNKDSLAAFGQNSFGIGQVKPYSINEYFASKFGLNSVDDYKDPAKNVLATFAHMYEDVNKAKRWANKNKELDESFKNPYDLAYPVYNSPSTVLSGNLSGQESPDNIKYRRFLEYKKNIPVIGNIKESTFTDPVKSFLRPVEIVNNKEMVDGGPIWPKPAARQGSVLLPGESKPSTHLYASGKSEGKHYAFPTLFQTAEGSWYQHADPFEHSLEIGEALEFNKARHAKKYAKGAWKQEMAYGGLIKRADGSYSKRGLWDNIRANKGSGKKPTKEMLEQERKIKAKMEYGGWLNTYEEGGPIEPEPPLFGGTLRPVEITPYTKDYPYYNDLTKVEKQFIGDTGPIGRSIKGKARHGEYIDVNQLKNNVVNAVTYPVIGALQGMQVPQATMIEGIEQFRGNPYDYSNVLPRGVMYNKQRAPSDTFLKGTGLVPELVGDMVLDPLNLLGVGFIKGGMKDPSRYTLKMLNKDIADISKSTAKGIKGAKGLDNAYDVAQSDLYNKKWTKFSEALKGTAHLLDEIQGELLQGRINRESIKKGNEWLESWINSPFTKQKIDKDIDAKIDFNKQFINNSEDQINFLNLIKEQSKNFKPNSKEYSLLKQLDENLQQYLTINSNTPLNYNDFHIHKGNFGVSYAHQVPPQYRFDVENNLVTPYNRFGSWISRATKIPQNKRVNTTIHEGVHDWVSEDAFGVSDMRGVALKNMNPEIKKDFMEWERYRNSGIDPVKKMGKERAYQAYLANPTEQHARIMELRHQLGIKPNNIVSEDNAKQIINLIENGRTTVDPKFLNVIDKDPKKLSTLFNKFWAVPPAAIGGVGALQQTEQKQMGGWLNKYN